MTETTRIPAAEVTGFTGALIKRCAETRLGRAPSSLGVHWHDSAAFTLEREVLAYAEAMTEIPPTVTDEMVASLRARLGHAALVELTAVLAFANFTTRPNDALGIESDDLGAA